MTGTLHGGAWGAAGDDAVVWWVALLLLCLGRKGGGALEEAKGGVELDGLARGEGADQLKGGQHHGVAQHHPQQEGRPPRRVRERDL